MLTKLEQLLNVKTNGKKSHVFFTQWQVAKDYIPQVLNTISQVFPHFSLHDSTHSETIINNIGRVIGQKNIEALSPVDIWLILSAAYYHDIGMVVWANEKIDFFQNDDFIDFVKANISDDSSPLHEYALCFDVNENKIYYKNNQLSAHNYDAARFIVAEYVRKKHGERASESIRADISMNLPGGAIPKRIINILGDICHAHTQSFDKVMELPFCEAGIDQEDCHPRYIASLLRLGDLLDLDNNRFSEVLLQTLPSIPIDSVQHKEKHMSIKHLQITEKKIEAYAECDDYDVADLTNRWFSLIDTELYNQMKNWNDIVPDMSFGFLPTLGVLDVSLKGYDTINGKDRPSFKIDTSKAIELLQGAGLYTEPYQSIRELLQNAVDATLLRMYLDFKSSGVDNITQDSFRKRADDYPIKVAIKKKAIAEGRIEWDIKISDKGIGMSKSDISYLTTTGSSSKNNDKKKIIEQMPEWMKPSGTFGIGFQSIFLLTDSVEIKTRKYNKETELSVSLFNPAGKKEGAVLIQSTNDAKIQVGTELHFTLIRNTIPDRWSVSLTPSMATNTISSYDFVCDESLDIDIAKIIDEIYQFSYASPIPISLIFNGEEYLKPTKENPYQFKYYCEETGLELSISPSDNNTRIYYRNQIVRKASFDFPFLSFKVNILSGDAKKALTLNRDDIQSDYKRHLVEDIVYAALKELQINFDDYDMKTQQYASLFIDRFATKEQKQKYKPNVLSFWKDVCIGSESCQKTLSEILEYENIVLVWMSYINHLTLVEEDANTIAIFYSHQMVEFIDFVTKTSSSKTLIYCLRKYNDEVKQCVILQPGEHSAAIIDDWKSWFNKYLSHNHYARSLMPCVDKYSTLRIKPENLMWGSKDYTFEYVHKSYPIMICPYIRVTKDPNNWGMSHDKLQLSVSEKLYQTVFDNRYDQTITLDEIKRAYQQFIDDTEQYVQSLL